MNTDLPCDAKRPVNVSVNPDRFDRVRQEWQDKNAAAIDAYNERVTKERILSDFDRLF